MNEFNLIKKLEDKKDIEQFIKYRLFILGNKDRKRIGLGTGVTLFDGFLDDKITYNIGAIVNDKTEKIEELNKLVFDDNNIYKKLVKTIRKNSGDQYLDDPYHAVHIVVRSYLSSITRSKQPKGIEKRRHLVYASHNIFSSKPVSLKSFHRNKLSMCTELAGASHNLFKFLGIDCDLVATGTTNSINDPKIHELHAFNILYPEGRDTYAIIFDSAFTADEMKNPTMFYIDKETKEDLLSFKKVSVNEKDITKAHEKVLKTIVVCMPVKTEYSIFKDAYVETMVALDKERNKKLVLKKEKE